MPDDDFDIYGEDDGFSSVKVEVSLLLDSAHIASFLTPAEAP